MVKNLPINAGDIRDTGSIPGSGRSPGGERGNPLRYSCLGNPMDKGTWWATVQFSSVTQLCLTLCDPMDCSTPGFPVHQLLKLAQTQVHRVGDAIQPSHFLLPPSPPPFNLPQHQGLFQCVRATAHRVPTST